MQTRRDEATAVFVQNWGVRYLLGDSHRRKPRHRSSSRANFRGLVPALTLAILPVSMLALPVRAADEFTGKFVELAPNTEEPDQVVFKPITDLSHVKIARPIEAGAHVTGARIYQADSGKFSMVALLVEPERGDPYLYADLQSNRDLGESERFQLRSTANPYVWETTVNEPLKEGPFKTFPVVVQYYKNTRNEEMNDDNERLVLVTRNAFARGTVDIRGKATLVQYAYDPHSGKINPMAGKIGVDSNGDGAIDLGRFSPESAVAENEEVVFRVGDTYVSTKKADLEKNVIVMRSRSASDYKRLELQVGGEMPDFEFVDFAGKKRRFSEFHGNCVLIDFWGMWCPACRSELPYLKAAYTKFHPGGFEILGMDTDEPNMTAQVQGIMQQQGMTWTQARRESILRMLVSLRVTLFPTSLLVGKDGKIISLDDETKGQVGLRGTDLLKSLDKVMH